VNFTREPIIETIITPKEGYRLVVRNSKGASQEEHAVDAIEVVSFGPAIFYRSLERPKPFLLPVADFEVIEVKETRVILKNVNLERSIKIGGGKEPPKLPKEQPVSAGEDAIAAPPALVSEGNLDKKRDRRHRRRRRGERGDVREERRPDEESSSESAQPLTEEVGEGGGARDETQVSSPTFTTLFPPPTTLISQTIARYKDQGLSEGNVPSQQIAAPPAEAEKKEEKKEESSVVIPFHPDSPFPT
jgi:hypothetical protein